MIFPKAWGYEDEVVNLEYCGKRMLCKEQHRSSIHRHVVKDEVLMVSNDSGLLWFEYGENPETMTSIFLQAMDRIRVKPNTWHRFSAMRDTYIYEFSTHHDDSDSIRHVMGGKIDDEEFRQLFQQFFYHENADRVVDAQTAKIIADALHKEKRVIGMCNGCFDLMHLGHMSLLAQARERCEILFVAVNDDASVRQLKGPTRPFVDERGRLGMVAGNRFVDYVIPCSAANCLEMVDAIRPDVYVTTTEYGTSGTEARKVAEQGGRIEVVDMIQAYNTTVIARRILGVQNESPRVPARDIRENG